jgi:hypothetical protein
LVACDVWQPDDLYAIATAERLNTMTTRLIVAEIKCQCGKPVNVRLKQEKPGDSKSRKCWQCNRTVTLKGTQGFVDGKLAQWTDILSNEVVKGEL